MTSIVLLQRDDESSPHLGALIESAPAFEVVGVAHTLAEGRELVARTHPGILVTDLRLQDGDVRGLWADFRRRPSYHPHVLVTMVSHDDNLLVEALHAGADGYWIHARSSELLIETLEQLSRGESPISPMIARELLAYFEPQVPSVSMPKLTAPEREVLQWVAKGYLIGEIAQQSEAHAHQLGCTIRQVYRKLQHTASVRHDTTMA